MMKKNWNSLIQRWIYELESCDITLDEESHQTAESLVLVISSPELEEPHRVDVDWT
jgi:hypothetical protein